MMKTIRLPAVILALSTHALAAKTMTQELMSLEPEARMEQTCNGRASGALRHDHKLANPDEVVAYAFSDVAVHGSSLDAPGAAIRSKGAWYRLSYHCKATDDGLGIVSFDYKLGAEVPRADWDDHYLVP
jgi:hypothetical protein